MGSACIARFVESERASGGGVVTTWQWFLVGFGVWLAAGLALGLVLGRVLRAKCVPRTDERGTPTRPVEAEPAPAEGAPPPHDGVHDEPLLDHRSRRE